MKVAVINFSGNVGKSTVARHLLAPRMPGAAVVAVETINSDSASETNIRGKEFGRLQEDLQSVDAAVIDVGASNVEDFIKLMSQYKGSHEDFDFFVVPTVPATKQQRDTIVTINALAKLGVPAKKIRVVFNMVEPGDNPESLFSGLITFYEAEKKFTLRPDCVIHTNEIFGKLKGSAMSIRQISEDGIDHKEKIKTAKNSEEKLQFAQLLSIKRLASGVTEELDTVFKALVK
jgi:hypothetical protein